MPSSFTNARTSSGPSSSETPTICKRSLYRPARSTSTGTSARHGGHHVAQKFSRTTFPFHAAVEKGLPSTSFARNAGMGWGLLANRTTRAPSACGFADRVSVGGVARREAAEKCGKAGKAFGIFGLADRPARSPIAIPPSPAKIANKEMKEFRIRALTEFHYEPALWTGQGRTYPKLPQRQHYRNSSPERTSMRDCHSRVGPRTCNKHLHASLEPGQVVSNQCPAICSWPTGLGTRLALATAWVAFQHDPHRPLNGEEGAHL